MLGWGRWRLAPVPPLWTICCSNARAAQLCNTTYGPGAILCSEQASGCRRAAAAGHRMICAMARGGQRSAAWEQQKQHKQRAAIGLRVATCGRLGRCRSAAATGGGRHLCSHAHAPPWARTPLLPDSMTGAPCPRLTSAPTALAQTAWGPAVLRGLQHGEVQLGRTDYTPAADEQAVEVSPHSVVSSSPRPQRRPVPLQRPAPSLRGTALPSAVHCRWPCSIPHAWCGVARGVLGPALPRGVSSTAAARSSRIGQARRNRRTTRQGRRRFLPSHCGSLRLCRLWKAPRIVSGEVSARSTRCGADPLGAPKPGILPCCLLHELLNEEKSRRPWIDQAQSTPRMRTRTSAHASAQRQSPERSSRGWQAHLSRRRASRTF